MTLRIAIQMDPVATIRVEGDTSLLLGLEAQKRGYKLYHYLPRDLSLRGAQVIARARPVVFQRVADCPAILGEPEVIDLDRDIDVVLMRQDPPVDMAYITATSLLDRIHPRTLVVNDPAQVRNCPEKIFISEFPELMPPTLISSDPEAVDDFRAAHRDLIVKPLYGNGGAGVFHIKPDDENLKATLELFANLFPEPAVIQAYLPDIATQGDKRIILIDGEPAGAFNRLPAPGEVRANVYAGGRTEAAELNERDREICARIGPTLRERGLILAGIDVIGDVMTEINVTSPGGVYEINHYSNLTLERDIWDAIEHRLAAV